MVNIAIFASGSGSNAEQIIKYFNEFSEKKVSIATKEGVVELLAEGKAPFEDARIVCVISNKKDVGVLDKARRYKIPKYVTNQYVEMDQILTKHRVHYIVLAGYLDKIPTNFCKKYKWRIINIHPALLQEQYAQNGDYIGGGKKYGGKGMYGMNVHNEVHKNKDKVTGISIHFVDEEYDTGSIFFHQKIDLDGTETPEQIKHKVQIIEHKFYPVIIEKMIRVTYPQLFKQ